jgi:hypothetical protein
VSEISSYGFNFTIPNILPYNNSTSPLFIEVDVLGEMYADWFMVSEEIIESLNSTIYSVEEGGASFNLGTLEYEGVNYSLPFNVTLSMIEEPVLDYYPAEGYEIVFLDTVFNEERMWLSLYFVYGNTTKESKFDPGIYSTAKDESTSNLGMIEIDSTNYTLPIEEPLPEGIYNVTYFSEEGLEFYKWGFGGDIDVYDEYSRSSTIDVWGEFVLVAVYGPPKK